MNIWA